MGTQLYEQTNRNHIQAAPFSFFSEAFALLKHHNIPTVLHGGEVPDSSVLTSTCYCKREEGVVIHDCQDIVAYRPNRIGHALFFVCL